MRDGELDGIDTLEIFRIHLVLAARPAVGFLTQTFLQCFHHGIKRSDMRQGLLAAKLFQPLTRGFVAQCIKDKAGIGLEVIHDPFKVLNGPHHRPEVALHIGITKLSQRRLGQHFQRFAG